MLGGDVQKDELIQVHALLCQLKRELEGAGVGIDVFQEYESLSISPIHVHRSKADHRRAIFILGKALARAISSGEWSGPARVGHRFEGFIARVR